MDVIEVLGKQSMRSMAQCAIKIGAKNVTEFYCSVKQELLIETLSQKDP